MSNLSNTTAATKPATIGYVPTAAVSAALKRELATAFPGVKFSVRKGSGTGSSWLSVTWTDGPRTEDVDRVCNPFHGAQWDGWNETFHQTQNVVTTTYKGQTYSGRPLVDGIQTRQDISDDARSEAARLWTEAHDGLQPEYASGQYGNCVIEGKIICDSWAPNQVLEIAREVVLARRWAAVRKAAASATHEVAAVPTPAPAADAAKETPAAPPADGLTIRHTEAEGVAVHGTTRGDGSAAVLKAAGFRWYRNGGFWYLPGTRTPEGARRVTDAADQLHAAGLALTAPATIDAPADVDAPAADPAPYATADNVGTRDRQCDATAVADDADSGARAYVLLDGIGSDEEVQEWTQDAAARLARAAAQLGDAEAGLRYVYGEYAADPERQDPYALRYMPKACAVVAVTAPDKPLTVAWCGDSRAYLLAGGVARRLTDDHNLRRVYPVTALNPNAGNRNVVTSCLGAVRTDDEARYESNHPAIEATTVPPTGDAPARLLLASDGAYEPHLDAGHDLFVELDDDPMESIARAFVDLAVKTSLRLTEADRPGAPYADNATVLLADLPTT